MKKLVVEAPKHLGMAALMAAVLPVQQQVALGANLDVPLASTSEAGYEASLAERSVISLPDEPALSSALSVVFNDSVRDQVLGPGEHPGAVQVMLRIPIEGHVWSVQVSVPVTLGMSERSFESEIASVTRGVLSSFPETLKYGESGSVEQDFGDPGSPEQDEAARASQMERYEYIEQFANSMTIDQVREFRVAYYVRPARTGDPTAPEPTQYEAPSPRSARGPAGQARAATNFAPSNGRMNIYLDPQFDCAHVGGFYNPVQCRTYHSFFSWSPANLAALKGIRGNLTYEHEMSWCDNSNSLFENWSTGGATGHEVFITDLPHGYQDTTLSNPSCSGGTVNDMTGGSSDAHDIVANHEYVVFFRVVVNTTAGNSELVGLTAQHGHRTPQPCHDPLCIFSNDSGYGYNNHAFFPLWTVSAPINQNIGWKG